MDQKQIDELNKTLNLAGEKKVKENLALGAYGDWKIKYVENWLREKEVQTEHDSRSFSEKNEERRHQEMLKEQKSLRTSSWIAAGAAVISAIIAVVAALIAYPHK